ncbi:DUF6471 domain-containing protein [Marinibactrum halimedae]|uniref:DUF6471 domain-containing protein n=1 Tax=Marinibactrum halimedae TaxID=1444977 RepID=A0AA37WK73_9GAMM|nr:DUF6471 domain-containing protein [Marinibactrum halimedae]MCD9461124.1 DUF6471 domain-containing protein [Marinibactrum halimedae]GLS24648.1 hypothetical protein GCM10007877_03620 [Marinibactrum halimedae]
MSERYKDPVMQEVIRRTIRAAMVEENIGYRELSDRLAKAGVQQKESTLRTKISTGIMTSSLFLHLLHATKVRTLDMAALMMKYQNLSDEIMDD